MELKELGITEPLDEHLDESSGKYRPKLTGQNIRITAGHNNINVRLSVVIPEPSFKFLDFLYLINQDIVVLCLVYLPVNVGNQVLVIGNEIKGRLFLINKDDIGSRLLTLPGNEFLHNIALAHTALAGENDQDALS